MRGRGAATLPGTPVLHNPTRGMRGATSSPHRPRQPPCQQARVCYAEPNTSDGASRHHSTSRTTLTILATTPGTVTQTRHPNDPQRTTGEGARQTDRHENEHSTTERTTSRGSHGEHRNTPRGTSRALPPTGGVHMSGTSETGSTATEHHEIPDNGLCMQHCQGGAGNRAPTGERMFYSGPTTCHGFSPPRRAGGAQYKRTVPAPHTWHRPTSQQAAHLHTTNPTARTPAATTRNKRRTNQPGGD